MIQRFYAAFAARDADAMVANYAPDVRFWDPVFLELRAPEAAGMWRMLAGRATDLTVELLEHEATEANGSARWRAHYTFTQTGRPVVNDVRAQFRFADGLIVDHRDEFDLTRWTRQALGPVGLFLGWTPVVRHGVQRRAKAGLTQFLTRGEQVS